MQRIGKKSFTKAKSKLLCYLLSMALALTNLVAMPAVSIRIRLILLLKMAIRQAIQVLKSQTQVIIVLHRIQQSHHQRKITNLIAL